MSNEKTLAGIIANARKLGALAIAGGEAEQVNTIKFMLAYRSYALVKDETSDTAKDFVRQCWPKQLDTDTVDSKASDMRAILKVGARDVPDSVFEKDVLAFHAGQDRKAIGGRSPYKCALALCRHMEAMAKAKTLPAAIDESVLAVACPPKAKPAKEESTPPKDKTPEEKAADYRKAIVSSFVETVNAAQALRDSGVKLSAKEKKSLAMILSWKDQLAAMPLAA